MCIRNQPRERANRVASLSSLPGLPSFLSLSNLSMVSGLGILCLVALACDDKRRHLPSEAIQTADVASPLAQTASPDEVARAFLTALRDVQHARAHGLGLPEKKRQYDEAMGTLKSLTASKTIHQDITQTLRTSLPRDVSEGAAVTTAMESWVSMLAYYVDGFHLDSIRVGQPSKVEPQDLTVYLQAESPEDVRRIRELREAIREKGNSPPGSPGSTTASANNAGTLREQALALDPPIALPLSVLIRLHLTLEEKAWRVRSVTLSPPPSPLPIQAPMVAPTPAEGSTPSKNT